MEWIVGIFNQLFDYFFYIPKWIFDSFLGIASNYFVTTTPPDFIANIWTAYGNLPVDIVQMSIAAGLVQFTIMILTAISIRFFLKLLPGF